MTVLIKDLLILPEQVNKGDFVLNLSAGVTDPDGTLKDYVVTPQLVGCFENALGFIKGAVQSRSSKAAYLHGSFGAGKSHFMAILHLILQHQPAARTHPDLAPVCGKHAWIESRKFLLVPYHMLGATSMESAILGGYAKHVRKLHPEAPVPPVFLADDIFADARALRSDMGDAAFFARLNQGAGGGDGWGELASGWDAARFEAALAAEPMSDERLRLVSDLVENVLKSYGRVMAHKGEAYVSLADGLGIISRHAQALGYDALILFLDELILWLASHAANLHFVQTEAQKLVKLVESEAAERPIPVVSFVARQRDLRDLVGDHFVGADQLNFGDILRHLEGRFHLITLEDRNLPDIAHKRVLKPRDDAARDQLVAAFEGTKASQDVIQTLLTSHGDREQFRKVYPFSPALVDTLVAVSSALQRERTALKIMLELLVEQRETLELGQIIPVGDLFDVVTRGEEALTEAMRRHFDNARRLYHEKLLPMLESAQGIRVDRDAALARDDAELAGKLRAFRNDDRLIKTLLLAALVPEVESFRNLDARRLAQLNHGTIKAPFDGGEYAAVIRKVRKWASQVGEIKIGDDDRNPTITIQVSGVDTEGIVERARHEDNHGNRRRKIRELLFSAMGIEDGDDLHPTHTVIWRGTKRTFEIVYANVRELSDEQLRCDGEHWKLCIDFPFDDLNYSPHDDLAVVEAYLRRSSGTDRTLVWLPSFFSSATQKELGTLVILDYILAGEQRFDDCASHLSAVDKASARNLLENQRSALRGKMTGCLETAYGVSKMYPDALEPSYEMSLAEHFLSLYTGFRPAPPVAANMDEALNHLLAQALEHTWPGHPSFDTETEIKPGQVKSVWTAVQQALAEKDGRLLVTDHNLRARLRQIAGPLKLGVMHETHFVVERHWLNHFNRKVAEHKPDALTVGLLHRWMDEPASQEGPARPTGLPPLLRNLAVLLYAEQTNRSFVLFGVAQEPEVDGVRPDMELRQQVLPDEDEWNMAITRGKALLSVVPPRMRNAVNLARFARDVKDAAGRVAAATSELPGLLRGLMKAIGMDAADDARRLSTAKAALGLISALTSADEKKVIPALAAASIPGNEVLGMSIHSAPELTRTLQGTQLTLFEALSAIADDRKERAEQILGRLREAVGEEEFGKKLAPVLAKAATDAALLLAQTPQPPTPPKPPPPPNGKRVVSKGEKRSLAAKDARGVLTGIAAEIQDGFELDVTWVLRAPGESK